MPARRAGSGTGKKPSPPSVAARRSSSGRRAPASTRRANPGALRRKSLFSRAADIAARIAGSPQGFVAAAAVVLIWGASGPAFAFSDTWQLIINTGTTVVTFLMIFLVQATQNRDSAAIHLKLDEIVRALDRASNELLDMEELTPEDLEQIRGGYKKLADQARNGA